jgi:adenylate cyclase
MNSRPIIRALVRRIVVANTVAAMLTAAAIEISEPARDFPIVFRVVGALITTLVIVVVLSLIAVARLRRREASLLGWLNENRPATDEERDRLLAQPSRAAREVLSFWIAGAVMVGLIFFAEDDPLRTSLAGFVATLLGGLTATTLSFFLGEQALRPAIVRALAGAVPDGATSLGVRRRVIAAWILGSGIPLAWIGLVPVLRHPTSDVPLAVLTTLLAILGIGVGFGIAVLAGRSIGRPVEQVRRGLEHVSRGDLDVTVTVDDPGELGLLEAGFNQMVRAIDERERLHDLFGRHVGEEVARQALARGVELGGEVRDVSVLFVDLVGSTKLVTEHDPTEIVTLLNRFFESVVHHAAAEGGWVNKFEGDAALCIFGAPEEQRDHGARALRAARYLRKALEGIDAGIGVSAGSVVAGNVGTKQRYEYTVIGHAVNEAARLVEQAKTRPSRVLASAAVIELAPDEAEQWTCVGETQLRGVPHPVKVYEPRD